MDGPEKQQVGPFIAAIVIVLILAVGGIYFAIQQAARIHAQQAAGQNNS